MTIVRSASCVLLASLALGLFPVSSSRAARAATRGAVHRLSLDRTSGLHLVRCRAQAVEYRGKHAMRLLNLPGQEAADTIMIAVLTGSDFRDGTIAIDVAGAPRPDVPGSRGFIGLAFHVAPDSERYECFYVRPTNARCDDQLRRNHTVQYISFPDFPWQRLRQESPGVYESYADMEPGAGRTSR